MKSSLRNRPAQRPQIVKNKEPLQSEEPEEDLWGSKPISRHSHNASLDRPRFDITTLLHLFTEHYVAVEQCFQQVAGELTRLESRLADCLGRFSEIEWRLSREVHSVSEAKSLNSSLLRINTEVQAKLALLKDDYEDLKRRRYVTSVEAKIDQLQQTVHKMELQSYRTRFSKQDAADLEDTLERLEKALARPTDSAQAAQGKAEVLEEMLVQLVGCLRLEGSVSEWVEGKLHENVTLKCELLRLQAVH